MRTLVKIFTLWELEMFSYKHLCAKSRFCDIRKSYSRK